jgi:alkylation response protein AidB-like acyl-CoA dehydrogenase
MHFAKTHKRAGKLVFDHQLVQLKLNEMHALTEALRSYVMRVAWERGPGRPDRRERGLAMNLSTDIIQRVTRLNMEIHGAQGCMMYARWTSSSAMRWCGTHLAGDTVQRIKILKRLK